MSTCACGLVTVVIISWWGFYVGVRTERRSSLNSGTENQHCTAVYVENEIITNSIILIIKSHNWCMGEEIRTICQLKIIDCSKYCDYEYTLIICSSRTAFDQPFFEINISWCSTLLCNHKTLSFTVCQIATKKSPGSQIMCVDDDDKFKVKSGNETDCRIKHFPSARVRIMIMTLLS